MRENESFKISVKNGLYIGDLCYALKDEVYHGVWGGADYQDGSYTDPDTGLEFAMVSTAFGDGYYASTENFNFPVDAGIIGITDLGLCDEEKDFDDCGLVMKDYVGEVFIEYDNGTININGNNFSIGIETYPDYEEDDEWTDDDPFDTDWD